VKKQQIDTLSSTTTTTKTTKDLAATISNTSRRKFSDHENLKLSNFF